LRELPGLRPGNPVAFLTGTRGLPHKASELHGRAVD